MGLHFGKVIKQSLERKLISGVKLTLRRFSRVHSCALEFWLAFLDMLMNEEDMLVTLSVERPWRHLMFEEQNTNSKIMMIHPFNSSSWEVGSRSSSASTTWWFQASLCNMRPFLKKKKNKVLSACDNQAMLTRYGYDLGFIEIFMEGGGNRISSHSLKKSGVGRLQTRHPEKDDKLACKCPWCTCAHMCRVWGLLSAALGSVDESTSGTFIACSSGCQFLSDILELVQREWPGQRKGSQSCQARKCWRNQGCLAWRRGD